MQEVPTKDYYAPECTTFCKTREAHGGLSMMAGGFTIRMGDLIVLSGEHLFQAMRFTDYPDIQKTLLGIPSPMGAKMFGRTHKEKTRPDWEIINIPIMEWALDLKLLNNWDTFGTVLRDAGDKPIVEISTKSTFWGAKWENSCPGILRGQNVMGILLWLQRLRYMANIQVYSEPHISIPNFHLLGEDAVMLAKRGLFEIA